MATATDSAKEAAFMGFEMLDKQIQTLFECKPLPESEIKMLCDKVSLRFGKLYGAMRLNGI